MNCTFTNQSTPSSAHERARRFDQLRLVGGLEVHGKAGPHRLARLGMADQEAAATADRVDGVLLALQVVHDEERREVVLAHRLERLVERERHRPGAGLEDVPAAVGLRRDHEEAAGALERRRLGADVDVRVAELVRRSPELVRRGRGDRARDRDTEASRTAPSSWPCRCRPRSPRARRPARARRTGRATSTPPRPRTTRAGRPRRPPRGGRARPGGPGTRPTSRAARRGTRRRSTARRDARSCRCRPQQARARRSAGATSRAARLRASPAAVTSTRSGRSRSWLSLVASPSRADPCGMVWNRQKTGSPSGLPADGREC